MRKFLCVLFGTVLFICLLIVFNIKVTTRQGINYKWHTIRIPLYLKILDFFDRHYNYKELVKRIVKDAKTEKEQAMKIFGWTHKNIRRIPERFPIIDDHVWYTIVRGYGVRDQSCDVFTTLCNYVGIDAFFKWVYKADRSERIPFSFVKIEGNWSVFDPFYGAYFKNKNGEIADIEELKAGYTWFIETIDARPNVDYAAYFDNLPTIKDIGLTRANVQTPMKRLLFEITSKMKKFKNE